MSALLIIAADHLADLGRVYAARLRAGHPGAREAKGRLRGMAGSMLRLLEVDVENKISIEQAERDLAGMVGGLLEAASRSRRLVALLELAHDCPDEEARGALQDAGRDLLAAAEHLERGAALLARHAETA